MDGEAASDHSVKLPRLGVFTKARSGWYCSAPAGYSTVRVISADFSSGAVKRTVTGPEVGAGPP